MNLNKITAIYGNKISKKIPFALPPIRNRTFPTHITHVDITTKPER